MNGLKLHRKNHRTRAWQKFQNTAEFRELLGKFGMDPSPPNTPEQFADIIRKDAGRWAQAVRVSGAKVD